MLPVYGPAVIEYCIFTFPSYTSVSYQGTLIGRREYSSDKKDRVPVFSVAQHKHVTTSVSSTPMVALQNLMQDELP